MTEKKRCENPRCRGYMTKVSCKRVRVDSIIYYPRERRTFHIWICEHCQVKSRKIILIDMPKTKP